MAEFFGNNNLVEGTIESRSASVVLIEVDDQLYFVKVPDDRRHLSIGQEFWFSVRADMMYAGAQADLANRIVGSYLTTEIPGSLETGVFELSRGPSSSSG